MREQAAALGGVRQRHPAEPAPVDARDAVVARHALVDEGVVGTKQVEDASILAQRAADEQLRLLPEAVEQALVVVRVEVGVDDYFTEATQIQPLRGKVVHERIDRLRIRQHPAHLLLDDLGLRQLASRGKVDQTVVRDAAP